MAVLLIKPPCVMETVNDLHGDLVNLAKVVQDKQAGCCLYRRLRRTLMCEQLQREAAERYAQRTYQKPVDGPDVDRAYDYFLCAWLGRNGVAGTQSYNQGFCVRYTANGGHAAKRWVSAINSIPAWRRRLANVTILQRDAFELLQKIEDAKGTAIYIDPPYIKKGAKYIHDFVEGDHERLAEILNKFSHARIVVSYYDDPLVRRIYANWTCHEINISKALANQGSRGEKHNKVIELLLVNEKAGQKGLFERR